MGGITSARANRKANQLVAEQKAANQAWYDKRYNEDATQRADAQRLLERTRGMLEDRYNRSAATSTVMGGTDEAVAMEKAAANQAMADVVSGIQADAANRKDLVEQQYMNANAALTDDQINFERYKAVQGAQAATKAGESAAGIVGAILDK